MAEKGLDKRDLEQAFKGFEKRQDKKLRGLEGRIDSRLNGLEERLDSKLKNLEERIVSQFHIISEGLIDQIKLLAEGHAGIINRLDWMEKESEHQRQETRSLVNEGNARKEKAGRKKIHKDAQEPKIYMILSN